MLNGFDNFNLKLMVQLGHCPTWPSTGCNDISYPVAVGQCHQQTTLVKGYAVNHILKTKAKETIGTSQLILLEHIVAIHISPLF